MIGVGMKATFIPAFEPKVDWALTRSTDEVTGTITYINWENKFFMVEFDCGGTKQRESFKFIQIGKDVRVHG